MPLFDVFPDAEAAASIILRNANISGGRVYSSIPATPTFPLIVVERVGGIPAVRQRLDRARVQISTWGNSKSETRLIAMQARAALLTAEGTTVVISTGNAVITGVDDDLGLFWSPDSATDRDRHIFGVEIFLHAP